MAFERTFQFLRNPLNAPVKVQINGVQAEVGALINIVGVGLGLSLATDNQGISTLTMTGGYSQIDGGAPGSVYTGPMNIDGGLYNSVYSEGQNFDGGIP